MLCPNCFQENDGDALFCKCCGSRLVKQKSTSKDLPSILLLVWAIIFIVTAGVQILLTTCINNWSLSSWRTFFLIVCIIQNASNILPAITVKNPVMRLAAIVMVAIPTICYICSNLFSIITGK